MNELKELNQILEEPKKTSHRQCVTRKREVKAEEKLEISDLTSCSEGPRKRGRKKENDDSYFQRAEEKINQVKEQLRTAKQDGMDVKERQRLRNLVSALQSRMKKKREVIQLTGVIGDRSSRLQKFKSILASRLSGHPVLEQVL